MIENKHTWISTRRFAIWTRELQRWLSRKFDSISIDLTPVEEKLDDVKSDVADVKTAVENIDFSELATEANATSNKNAIIAAINSHGGEPAVLQNGNRLTFRLFSLQQMEHVKIWLSGLFTPAKFTVTTDENEYYLNFSSDSPTGIAGGYIADDAIFFYTEKVLMDIQVDIPSGFTVSSVTIDGADCNLLTDTEWRIADIKQKLGNINIDTSDLAKEATLGTAPVGSQRTTVFQYLASIYESIVGTVSPDVPEGVADRLAAVMKFFGIYVDGDKVYVKGADPEHSEQIVPAEFMTDTEVTDELEDIMQALDPELEQEVEYPEGSGTYMTKAQAITAEAMQIINDDEEQS